MSALAGMVTARAAVQTPSEAAPRGRRGTPTVGCARTRPGGYNGGVSTSRASRMPTAVGLSALLVAAAAALSSPTPAAAAVDAATGTRHGTAAAPLELPRGGRRLFPDFRVVAYYGGATTSALGVLGEGTPDAAARRLARQARPYATAGRPVLPAFELIVTVAQSSAGADGSYSAPTAARDIRRYLAAARRAKALLVLDIQPGRGDFLTEVRRYERFLREPDVGLALDAEWSMRPGQVPGETIGSTDAATINRVSAWLDGLVTRKRLPQKLFVIHQFTPQMVRNRGAVKPRRGLAVTFHIDGFGGQFAKRSKYRQLRVKRPFFNGFKLFYDEDRDMLTPREVLKLRPAPDLVTYQ